MGSRKGGLVFIISAPSGTGKTTLIKKVLNELPKLKFSISYTTRNPRENEKNGEDYYFISTEEFKEMINHDEFLEWAEVLGNLYGTSKKDLEKLNSNGFDIILDIDPKGAKKVADELKNIVLIYILPPSPKVLKERLEKRGLDSKETINFRLTCAKDEIEEAHIYHYVIVNEKIDESVEKLKSIIIAERCKWEKDSIIEEKKHFWEEN